MTVRELGARLRERKISCKELIEETVRRIEREDRFNCFITRTFEAAVEQAARLDHRAITGPLHGIPIAHKDLYYTRGVRTTGGSPLFSDFIPETDGDVVANLKAAGAISVGKTNLHELAYGIASDNPHFGPVLNPHDTERIPGGSSGGSAVLVAAGLLPLATGTDTGGSIRVPASYCGIVGLKPTYDRLSRNGILPLNFSLDHAGPLGASVDDCAAMLGFQLGLAKKLDGLRVGVPQGFFFDRLETEIEDSVRSAIDLFGRHGAVVSAVSLPDFAEVNVAARVIQMAEAASLYINQQDEARFGRDVWTNLEDGRQILAHEYINAQRLRALHRSAMDEVWRSVDVLVMPTTPITAPLRSQQTVELGGRMENVRQASTRLVRGWNYLGEPAISLPCGKDSRGLPIGLQVVAKPFADERLLQTAKNFELLLADR